VRVLDVHAHQRRERVGPVFRFRVIGHQLLDRLGGAGIVLGPQVELPQQLERVLIRLFLLVDDLLLTDGRVLVLAGQVFGLGDQPEGIEVVDAVLDGLVGNIQCLGKVLLLEVIQCDVLEP